MKVLFDNANNNYDIKGMSYDEILELKEALDSCRLPQRRTFFNLKKDIDNCTMATRQPQMEVVEFKYT